MVQDRLDSLLAECYDEPERSVVGAEILHAIIGHRRRGEPYTVEAGVVRVADALDMAEGRSRIPVEGGQYGIHALSAAAIDKVRIEAGEERPVKIEIEMNMDLLWQVLPVGVDVDHYVVRTQQVALGQPEHVAEPDKQGDRHALILRQ
jgi:metal-dependent HD superfamily phosphatase/phosphodiesterase